MTTFHMPKGYSEILEFVLGEHKRWLSSLRQRLKRERDLLPIFCEYVSFNAIVAERAHEMGRQAGYPIVYGEFLFVSFLGRSDAEGWEANIPDSFAGNRFFWAVLMRLVKQVEFPSVAESSLRRALKAGRMKVSLEDRCQISTKYQVLEHSYRRIQFDVGCSARLFAEEWKRKSNKNMSFLRTVLQDDAEISLKTLKKLSMSGVVKVFRGFEVEWEQDVRVGRKLKGNDDALAFAPAFGISYSHQKSTALAFARARSEPAFGGKWTDRVDASKLLLEAYKADPQKIEGDQKRRQIIGKFEVDVEDILVCQFSTTEDELLIFPSDVRIKRYEVVG